MHVMSKLVTASIFCSQLCSTVLIFCLFVLAEMNLWDHCISPTPGTTTKNIGLLKRLCCVVNLVHFIAVSSLVISLVVCRTSIPLQRNTFQFTATIIFLRFGLVWRLQTKNNALQNHWGWESFYDATMKPFSTQRSDRFQALDIHFCWFVD